MKLGILIGALIALNFTGCDMTPSADQKAHEQQEQIEQQGQRIAGLPNISNFAEKKLLKTVLELRDNPKTINYAYLFAENSGKLIPLGRCYGYGIPYATQYTSPQKDIYYGTSSSIHLAMPQADPNGLFSPASADGTWLDLIDPKTGDHAVTYIEPRIIVSPIPLTQE